MFKSRDMTLQGDIRYSELDEWWCESEDEAYDVSMSGRSEPAEGKECPCSRRT